MMAAQRIVRKWLRTHTRPTHPSATELRQLEEEMCLLEQTIGDIALIDWMEWRAGRESSVGTGEEEKA